LIQENGDGKAKKSKGNGGAPARKNTAVYITNLPLDATADEVCSVFSKCGVIAEEIDRGKPRIKLYTDEAGNFKGDALVVYFRAESVALAVQMLDDTDFRFGTAGASGRMSVQAADFSYKSQQEAPAKSSMKDKKKIMRKTQKLNKWERESCDYFQLLTNS
jgi:HIV Tat-specific factor 1